MRGRKPIPTDLHKLRGTLNATRHGKGRSGEPEAAGDLSPGPPEWMSEGQRAGWRHAVELSPAYVDVAVRRWQDFTGRQAVLEGDGRPFHEVEEARRAAVTG